ncbi:MAG: hypothetical protein OJF55_001598 [Rhodanobacteraceae bacterium]|jgi:hypothetical protein|nr:MAG: hypothetical protein OJF55_001598 [Rhodanobacteraceae bacterium]
MPRSIVRTLCLLVLLACAPLLHAQTAQPVYRCIGVHGEPVFSGQPCGTPAPASSSATSAQGGSFGGACAATPQALRQSIADAFTSHDVNRLAGLILWRGMDQASAYNALRGLSEWLKQPLAGIKIAYASGPPPEGDPASAATAGFPAAAASIVSQPPIGLEISTGGGDGGTRDFGVTESGGCWWLTF